MSCPRRAWKFSASRRKEHAWGVLQFVPPSAWLPVLSRAKDACKPPSACEGALMFQSLLNTVGPALSPARVLRYSGAAEYAPSPTSTGRPRDPCHVIPRKARSPSVLSVYFLWAPYMRTLSKLYRRVRAGFFRGSTPPMKARDRFRPTVGIRRTRGLFHV